MQIKYYRKENAPKKINSLEIDQSADMDNSQKIEDLEKHSTEMEEGGLSRQTGGMIEDKS